LLTPTASSNSDVVGDEDVCNLLESPTSSKTALPSLDVHVENELTIPVSEVVSESSFMTGPDEMEKDISAASTSKTELVAEGDRATITVVAVEPTNNGNAADGSIGEGVDSNSNGDLALSVQPSVPSAALMSPSEDSDRAADQDIAAISPTADSIIVPVECSATAASMTTSSDTTSVDYRDTTAANTAAVSKDDLVTAHAHVEPVDETDVDRRATTTDATSAAEAAATEVDIASAAAVSFDPTNEDVTTVSYDLTVSNDIMSLVDADLGTDASSSPIGALTSGTASSTILNTRPRVSLGLEMRRDYEDGHHAPKYVLFARSVLDYYTALASYTADVNVSCFLLYSVISTVRLTFITLPIAWYVCTMYCRFSQSELNEAVAAAVNKVEVEAEARLVELQQREQALQVSVRSTVIRS
jgi:hypothetical protein